ncbi:hypothetical protein RFM41_29400 [Mesorhizobium sp. VK25A]|uniref:Uncharacterized protein n=1 Tax=Mesorhizobium vachelliae TaxID=3072309 RepID=A0ABU5A447_9HYPH|nr:MULTISPECIES: hypothetical protein [unclassified Mesorhizobium]MDX8532461.1 hypothetical protein [Mesorhizobium sp. VK25D]MDX8547893.1 hypothetical protein [Mesorhizobium sp. VK25A]
MADIEKFDGRKSRRSDSKTEAGKVGNALNFALTAGTVGLGLALLDQEQAAASSADSKASFSHDDDGRSDSSVSADQAVPGIDHSKTADHALHVTNADNGPAATNGGEIAARTAAASTLTSESTPETLRHASDSAPSPAAANDGNTANSANDVATVSTPTDTGHSPSAAHINSAEGGTIEGAHGASSVIDSNDALSAAGDALKAVGDVANNLLGDGGGLGVVPMIAETVDTLVGKDGVLGALVGEHNSDVLGGLTVTSNEILEGLVGKDGALGGVLGGGLVGDGDGGVATALTGSHGGIVGGLINAAVGLLGGGASSEAAADGGATAHASDAASTQGVGVTETQADVASGAPSNMFEVAHAALQITEGVADAITPTLTFVGQPIIEDDAHTDTDHSIHVSIQHVA